MSSTYVAPVSRLPLSHNAFLALYSVAFVSAVFTAPRTIIITYSDIGACTKCYFRLIASQYSVKMRMVARPGWHRPGIATLRFIYCYDWWWWYEIKHFATCECIWFIQSRRRLKMRGEQTCINAMHSSAKWQGQATMKMTIYNFFRSSNGMNMDNS